MFFKWAMKLLHKTRKSQKESLQMGKLGRVCDTAYASSYPIINSHCIRTKIAEVYCGYFYSVKSCFTAETNVSVRCTLHDLQMLN